MSELAQSSRSSPANSASAPKPPASSTAKANANATANAIVGSRSPPYMPTYREAVLLVVFPTMLLFGVLFSLLSPNGRAGLPGAAGGAGSAPSYFARKDNVLNVFFVKRGWFWISLAFAQFIAIHPAFGSSSSLSSTSSHTFFGRRASAVVRWGLVTGWWILVTQWFFGPPLIDRSFRLTGGSCIAEGMEEAAAAGLSPAAASLAAVAVAATCKRSGGRWSGGHDISGHVFMLVLGSTFLAQEVGWVLLRARAGRGRSEDDRTIVMADGAVKTAEVEAEAMGTIPTAPKTITTSARTGVISVRFVGTVVALSLWMLLMTAIYFHTWLEKLTGLLVALTGLYGVYVVPRFVPAVRRVVGLPGL